MLSDLAGMDSPFRLILDSVDFFFEVLEPHDVTTVARQIRHRCQTIGGQALLTIHSVQHDRAVYGLLQDLADLVFDLRADVHGARYAHTLFTEKVGNRPDLCPDLSRPRRRERLDHRSRREPPGIVAYAPVTESLSAAAGSHRRGNRGRRRHSHAREGHPSGPDPDRGPSRRRQCRKARRGLPTGPAAGEAARDRPLEVLPAPGVRLAKRGSSASSPTTSLTGRLPRRPSTTS